MNEAEQIKHGDMKPCSSSECVSEEGKRKTKKKMQDGLIRKSYG
jgi:hypothetical protein